MVYRVVPVYTTECSRFNINTHSLSEIKLRLRALNGLVCKDQSEHDLTLCHIHTHGHTYSVRSLQLPESEQVHVAFEAQPHVVVCVRECVCVVYKRQTEAL